MADTVLDFAAAAATRNSRRTARTAPVSDRELLQQLVDDLHVLIVERPLVVRVVARFTSQARQHTASSSSAI